MIEVRPDVADLFPERDVAAFLAIGDRVARAKDARSIGRFERGDPPRGFYIKKHGPCGWWAIVEDVLRLRRPHVGARPEYDAIRACERLGVPTMAIAAFGEEGRGASQRSFLVTDEITPNVSLEDLTRDWPANPPPPDVKHGLIAAVAGIARRLHEGGVNHRDFYLCHFLLAPPRKFPQQLPRDSDPPALRVIDLHRAQVRRVTPRRWIVKDVAGLYFSAMDIGLTRCDLLRFVVRYGRRDAAFWRDVQRRAAALYRKEFRREPRLAL